MSIGTVLANARRRAGLSVAQVSEQTRITETTYVCECQQYGKTMFQLFPDHKVTDEYRQLVRELEARLDATEGVEREVPVGLQAQGEVVHG